MNLETERLILRNLRESDLADFLEYRSDPEVCEFQSYEPFSEAQAERYIKNLENGEFGEAGKWIQLGIELKDRKQIDRRHRFKARRTRNANRRIRDFTFAEISKARFCRRSVDGSF